MPPAGNPGPDDEAQPLKRIPNASRPISLSPTDRLAAMTRERIDALEVEKAELKRDIVRLSKLAPENARLQEALGHAESNSVLATVLIGVGGFLVSYATFTGRAADKWANAAAGCLLAGIAILTW